MECRKVNELRELCEALVVITAKTDEFLELMLKFHIPDFHWASELMNEIECAKTMIDRVFVPEYVDSECACGDQESVERD